MKKIQHIIPGVLIFAICLFSLSALNAQDSARAVLQYTGADQTFIVPPGVTQIYVKLWGAGGAGGNYVFNDIGGGGGFASGILDVTPGEQLVVLVGGGGQTGAGPGAYGGGGAKSCGAGGRGGGRSGIRNSSNIELITAGAGGGGGGAAQSYETGGHGGGGLTGTPSNFNPPDGGPGTQTQGGAGGVQSENGPPYGSNAGGQFYGGDAGCADNGYNGSGGSGYFGGGSGTDVGDGAGGGGSSFIPAGGYTEGANNDIAGNTADPDYADNAGYGGQKAGNGNPGRVVIIWQKRPIVIAISVASILCNGGSTTLTVHATGGDGTPYLFKLDSGSCQPDSNFIVSAGSYTITVKDAEGLINTANITVYQPTALTATIQNKNPHLYYGYSGDQMDTINVTPSGGTGPYTVSITMDRNIICNYINDAGDETWTASSGTTTNNVCGTITGHPVSTKAGISSGAYSVYLKLLDSAVVTTTVTDQNGCTFIRKDSVLSEDVRCFAGNSKITKVQLCHRTGSPSNPCVTICVDSSAVAEHLAHGDSFGPCPKNGCGTSYNSSAPVIVQTLDLEKLKVNIMPNPSLIGTDFRLTTSGVSNQEIQIRVLNMLGKEVYATKGAANETYKFGANFLSGVYVVVVIQNNNVQTLKVIKH